jgi:hypothetical protein
MFLQVRHFATDAHGAKGGFSADVRIAGGDDGLDFGEEIAGHFDAGDVAQCAKGEADDVLVAVVKIAELMLASTISFILQCHIFLLLQRVCDQRQDLLILIQQQHGTQISQSLVREARRSEEFEAFDLTEVRSFAQGEEVE